MRRMSRRRFLQLLAAAPLAAPAIDRAAEMLFAQGTDTQIAPNWWTNFPTEFRFAGKTLRYSLVDARGSYAYFNLPPHRPPITLSFDVLPLEMAFASNFRMGVAENAQLDPNSIYVDFSKESAGNLVYLAARNNSGYTASVNSGRTAFLDKYWHNVRIAYDPVNASAAVTVFDQVGQTLWTATVLNRFDHSKMRKIMITDVPDKGYPGATAVGYVKRVQYTADFGSGLRTIVAIP